MQERLVDLPTGPGLHSFMFRLIVDYCSGPLSEQSHGDGQTLQLSPILQMIKTKLTGFI